MNLRALTFEEFGKLMIAWTGMRAVIDYTNGCYTAAGIQIAIGLFWILVRE